MSKRLIICVAVTALAAMVSSLASAGDRHDRVPVSDIALSLLSYGLAPESDAVRRGPYYILHARNPWGREVRVVADAHFGDILSVVPVYSWRTNPFGVGATPRIIHVPEDIFGGRDAAPSSRPQSGRADTLRHNVSSVSSAPPPPPQRADADKALTPIHSTPDFGPKVGDGASFDRLPPPPSQRVE